MVNIIWGYAFIACKIKSAEIFPNAFQFAFLFYFMSLSSLIR